ncbi:MAG: T9SS type A sorting domain-containing protein [Bacteroidetes bacterium]|nr:T9SS type A sorting domain-containing protein [Bacteroidota bacterium]
MEKKARLLLVLLMCTIFALGQDDLQLNSVFSTVDNCGYKTKGIFVAWWDKAYDYADEAEDLLLTLVDCQNDCLNTYQMRNPPNPLDGYYYNVYIHNGHDLFPDGWAMGQGTDSNGYPYLTIPIGYANRNNAGLQHEGFHIFQYNANSPGYAYSGDSQWYIEATANWYAALKHPGSKDEYVTASCITFNPQVPMWYTYNNREAQDQANWQRFCHQYGMNIMINYLTDVRGVSPEIIVGGFFAETNDLPQEYLYKEIGADTFSELFADYAAHNVGGFEHFPVGTEARSYQELKNYGDLNDVHPIVKTFTNEGSNGEWISPENDFVTRAWAYNVYKIENSQRADYTFDLKGDSHGRDGDLASFKGRIVVKKDNSVSYYDMDMLNLTDGSFTYKANPDDEEVYLVIISTPVSFRGNQKFFYQVKIDYSVKTGIETVHNKNTLGENYPNPFDSITSIPYELILNGEVTITITDMAGRQIIKLYEGEKPAGRHTAYINVGQIRTGTYYYTLETGNYIETKTMSVK